MRIPRLGMHGLNALSVRTIPEGYLLADSGELVMIPKPPGPGLVTYLALAAAGWWLWRKYGKGGVSAS